jgi:mRNA interferase RelE/StbE
VVSGRSPARSRRGVKCALRLSAAAHRALSETLPEQVAAAVWKFVSGPLLEDPHRVAKRLRFDLEGFHSARRGQYKVIYRILDDEVVVDVIKISHGGDIYGSPLRGCVRRLTFGSREVAISLPNTVQGDLVRFHIRRTRQPTRHGAPR